MVAIIDYDAGNIKSVQKAIELLGAEVVVTREKEILLKADKVILPGVGAFGDAMEKLRSYELEDVIKAIIKKGTPFLGICLGLQLLFEESEESPGVKGLGILEGKIVRFSEEHGLKIPHIGWNSLTYPSQGTLYKGIKENSYVYFVHSYYAKATDRSIVKAITEYGDVADASVQKENVYACQFHPEKSSDVGLQILKNFLEI